MGDKRIDMKFLIPFLLFFSHCVLFQKSVKIQPIPFNYQEISKNYFSPKNDKPFPLTIQRGNNLYNSTTKDGKYLFYATNKEGNFDIWFRDLSSSIVVPVTSHPSQEYKPAISPNGDKLVFVSEEYDSEGDLILLELNPKEWVDGSLKGKRFLDQNFQVLTNPEWKNTNRQQKVIDTDPTWMPDGERIVFSSDRFSPGVQNLILLNINDENSMIQLTTNGATSPFVSQDGAKIYYLSYLDSTKGEIYSLNLLSGQNERITKNEFLDFSPSISSDNRFLYYTSIRKDTNQNQVLDERDNSYIVRMDLKTGSEKLLSSGETSVFDTRYSNFNGGSILFSASFFNSINVYFIPYTGSIPKQDNIIDQYNYALDYEKTNSQSRFFLALDSVELFFENDPLYPIFHARIDAERIKFLNKNRNSKLAEILRDDMEKRDFQLDPVSIAYSYSLKTDPNYDSVKDINELLKKMDSNKEDKSNYQEKAAILHLLVEVLESRKINFEAKERIIEIQTNYPDYHLIRDIRNRSGHYEFNSDSIEIPNFYKQTILAYDIKIDTNEKISPQIKLELKDILLDIEAKVFEKKTSPQVIEHVIKMESDTSNPNNSNLFKTFLIYMKAKALRSMKNLTESSNILDQIIPIPQNLELDPPGQKSVFEYPEFIKIYNNPSLSYIHLLRYNNAQDQGNGTLALRNLRIFMEFYDPLLSPELKEEEFSRLFLYWENKAIEYERIGDLRQAAVHYYFNNLGMSLAKAKNISVEKFYGNYAVYYQRKMLETIFRYGKELREQEEAKFLNQLNILGEGKLDIIGNLSNTISIIDKVPIPYLDRLKLLGDFKDLQNKDVLHENATALADLYFNYHLEKNRPFLNLAVVYGYAYYLINRAVINENYLYQNNSMTASKKQQILENLKKAEYELKWILFADPTSPDAYQLLGWMYQYIDIIKTKKNNEDDSTEEEKYSSVYEKFFPEKNFEQNVELYSQILEFLGKDYKNKKILSDLNLNLGNNYFLLSIYPKSNEASSKVENFGKFILSRSQFESYQQEAVFHYNYGRSSLYRADYAKAIEQFQLSLKIYEDKEFYQSLSTYAQKSKTNSSDTFLEVKRKLAILNALIGLCKMELGEYAESIAHFQSAISQNRQTRAINELNLWNSLAIAFQKNGRFKESREILDIADREYKDEKSLLSIFDFSFSKIAWNFALPDKVRVSGEGRFPNEFPLEFKRLLTKSIRINNYILERDYKKAIELIEERESFIQSEKLKNWEMGILVSQQSNATLGQIFYDSKDFFRAYEKFSKIEEDLLDSENSSTLRTVIIRKNYSAFSLAENSYNNEINENILKNNIKSLLSYREKETRVCRVTSERELCNLRFSKDFQYFDILMGLNYFYLGSVYEINKDLISSIESFGKSLSYLKNPGNLDQRFFMLSQDRYTRRERIRNFINLSKVYYKLEDMESVEENLKLAKEFSYEFNLDKEGFYSELTDFEIKLKKTDSKKSSTITLNNAQLNLDRIWERSIALRYQLKDRTISDFFDLKIGFAYLNKKEKEISLFRDELRSTFLHKEVLLASLEYSELKLDKITKEVRKNLNTLLSSIHRYEQKLLQREPIQANIIEIKKSERNLLSSLSELNSSYPEDAVYYNPFQKQRTTDLPDKSRSLRCFQNGSNFSIWIRDKQSFKIQTVEEKDLVSTWYNLISNKHSNSSEQDFIYINPDNCYTLYNQRISNNNLFWINQDKQIKKPQDKEGQEWRWRTSLSETSNLLSSNLQFSEKELLGSKLLDTDLLLASTGSQNFELPLFSYNGNNSLNLRELFTSKSEITSVVIQSHNPSPFLIDSLRNISDLFERKKAIHIIYSRPLKTDEKSNFSREQFKSNGFILGVTPNFIDSNISLDKFNVKRKIAIELERARDYNSSYDIFYEASSYINENLTNESLDNKIDLARIKRKLFPNLPTDSFFKPLIVEYKNNQSAKDRILKVFLRECFSDRSIRIQRNSCENYYQEWKKESKESATVEFFYKMYKGEIKNLDPSLLLALQDKQEDPFILHMRISDLFLENFLFEESYKFTKLANNYINSNREKSIVESRFLEILYHRAFLEGRSDFAYKNIQSNTTYALGFNRDWEKFTEKVNSEAFKKLGDSDSIYDEYRKRLYNKWRDWESGKEFEPITLIPDELYEGGSVISKMTHLNRSLYFYLLHESSKHQLNGDANSLMDILINEEEKEGFINRSFAYTLYYADQLIRNGDIAGAQYYIRNFEKKYNADKSFHPFLEKQYIYLNFKLSLYKDDIAFLRNTEKFLDEDVKNHIQFFSKAKKDGPEQFANVLNSYINNISKTKKTFSLYERKKTEDLLQFMFQISLESDSSEGFLDVVHFKDSFNANNEFLLGRRMLIDDIPKFNLVSSKLMKFIPDKQNLHVISDFMDKTYLVSVSKGKNSGRILFPNKIEIQKSIRQYNSSSLEGGEDARLRDIIDDKYRNTIRMQKDSINYLYLSSYHLKAPLLQKLDNHNYHIQNLESLIKNPTTKLSDITWSKTKIKHFNESNPETGWYKDLKNVENWELQGIDDPKGKTVHISQEDLTMNNTPQLVFGGESLLKIENRKSIRNSIWTTSSFYLGREYFLSDLLNHSLHHLDSIHKGAGVISIEDQSDFPNSYFLKELLSAKPDNMQLRYRLLEARDNLRNRYPFDKYWHGYRMYTSSFLTEN
jgi:Tol biopolymer transport system component